MRELLDRLVKDMVDRGIDYHDAQRAFERRFISEVVARSEQNLSRAATKLHMHRNTLSRKMGRGRATKKR